MTNQTRPRLITGQAPDLGIPDAVGLALLVATLLTLSYIKASRSMFWSDEIMGLLTLRQPTVATILHAWNDGIDSSGIFFYVFGVPWTRVLGFGEVSLRLFSAVFVAASAVVIWITARRLYPFWPVAAAVSTVFASSLRMRWQLANGRSYGIFAFAIAACLYLIVRGEDDDTRKPTAGFLLLTCGTYCLLMGSHILGVIYLVGLLGIQIGLDLYRRRVRLSLYLAALPSFAVLLFSRANIHSTTALGKPVYWTVRPKLHDLLTGSIMLDHRVSGAIVVLAVGALLVTRFGLSMKPIAKPVVALLAGFVMLDVLIYGYSRISTSIYVERYFLPFDFPAILLLCALMTQFIQAKAPLAGLRSLVPPLAIPIAIAGCFLPRLQRPWLPIPDYTSELLSSLPPGVPLVDTDTGTFVELEYYRHDQAGRRILYPVDWEIALDRTHPVSVSGPHEMDNFKAENLDAADILPTQEILQENREFVVFCAHDNLWLKRRVLENPKLTASQTGTFTLPMMPAFEIWTVQTRP